MEEIIGITGDIQVHPNHLKHLCQHQHTKPMQQLPITFLVPYLFSRRSLHIQEASPRLFLQLEWVHFLSCNRLSHMWQLLVFRLRDQRPRVERNMGPIWKGLMRNNKTKPMLIQGRRNQITKRIRFHFLILP